MINIPQAAAQSDARRNSFWGRPITARRGNKKNFRVAKGMFHQICDGIQHSLIDVGVEDSHEKDTIDDWELGDQQRSKRDKEKIMEEKGLKKAQKKLINAIYCYQIYFSSACVKDDPKLVRKRVEELYLDAARHRFLCRNIDIRTIGFGGEFQGKYEIKWSQN